MEDPNQWSHVYEKLDESGNQIDVAENVLLIALTVLFSWLFAISTSVV
ncbi:hypothetical protein [Rhodoferax sp.]|nr:hypothetical protein [Rhodoferax sp.]MDD2919632.1 hypothetical protein [Rhodoferax sp.]